MTLTFCSTISKDIPASLVIPRYDADSRIIRARYNSGHTSRASLLHLPPPPEAGPRIECGVTQCASGTGRHSRHSAPRRGIQNYPGKNSGRTNRAALLHPLPPPEAGPRIKCGVTQCASGAGRHSPHSALRRGIQKYPGMGISQDARAMLHYSTLCHLQKLGPASRAGDTPVIPRHDAESRSSCKRLRK